MTEVTRYWKAVSMLKSARDAIVMVPTKYRNSRQRRELSRINQFLEEEESNGKTDRKDH